jgi:hypothetical protein
MTGRISSCPFNNHIRHKPLQTMGGYHRGYPVRRKAVARTRLRQILIAGLREARRSSGWSRRALAARICIDLFVQTCDLLDLCLECGLNAEVNIDHLGGTVSVSD